MDQILVSVCCPPQNEHIDIKKVVNSHVGVTLKSNVHVIVRYMLSPVRLSSVYLSVTFVRPTQPFEMFGNVSSPFGTLAIH